MAKKSIDGVIGYASGSVVASNYIQQINDGQNLYDIAVKSGITFFQGNEGDGVVWDGTQPLEVVIPTLGDIIANPVTLKGVVNSAADVPSTASNGDLLYIGADGEYFTPAVACEAGDMAVYYNNAWHVISGENQVSLAGGTASGGNHTVLLSGTATKVLDVEGKSLNLGVDYSDVRSNLNLNYVTNASDVDLSVDGNVTVAAMSIALSQASGTTKDISTSVSIDLPTKLASGVVTIDSVLQKSDISLNSGSYPTLSKDSNSVTVNTSHNLTISASGEGSFVTAISAIKKAQLVPGDLNDNQIAYVSGLASASGTSFVTNAHVYDSTKDEGKEVAFTLWGQVSASRNSFVSGLGTEAASGDVVTKVTGAKGAISLVEGSDFLTGLSTNGSDVVTSVTFGTLAADTTGDWFYSGLSADNANGNIVTGVDFGSIAFSLTDDSTYAAQAVTTASVSNHVLSFTTASFMKPVSATLSGNSVSKAVFTKSGVKLSDDWTYASKGFTSTALSQADVTISYKDVLSADLGLAQSSASYVWDTAQDHAYSVQMSYAKISTEAATTTNSGAVIAGDVTASIAAGNVVTAVSLNADGVLPTLTIGDPTGKISGTVDTALTTSSVSWLAIDSSKKDIAIAGAYTLVTDSSVAGAIAVAAAGDYSVNASTVATIPADSFVVDITVDGSSVHTA